MGSFSCEGSSSGPRLKGTLTDVDYLQMRADGRTDLHIHAEITNEDGEKSVFLLMELPLLKKTQVVFKFVRI